MSGFKKTVFDKLVVAMVALQQQANPEPTAKPKTATKRSKNFIEAVEARAKGIQRLAIELYLVILTFIF